MNGFVGLAFVAVLLLPVMAMTVKNVTSTRRGNLALAAAFLAGAVILGAIAASRLEAISRLREHGLTANATTTNVDENFVSFTGHAGWSTTVTVSFTDTSGGLVRAQYTNNARGVEVQHWYGQQSSMGLAPPARHHQRLNAARKLTPGALHTGTTVGHSPAPLALRGLGVGGRLGSAFRRGCLAFGGWLSIVVSLGMRLVVGAGLAHHLGADRLADLA